MCWYIPQHFRTCISSCDHIFWLTTLKLLYIGYNQQCYWLVLATHTTGNLGIPYTFPQVGQSPTMKVLRSFARVVAHQCGAGSVDHKWEVVGVCMLFVLFFCRFQSLLVEAGCLARRCIAGGGQSLRVVCPFLCGFPHQSEPSSVDSQRWSEQFALFVWKVWRSIRTLS